MALIQIFGQAAPLPGLPGQGIDPSSGDPVGAYVVRNVLPWSFTILSDLL